VAEDETIIQRYRRLVQTGEIRDDDAQRAAAEKLQFIQYRLAAMPRRRGLAALFSRRRRRVAPGDCGLYLYGGVGRGKSMLMDLFYMTAPDVGRRRVHFHAFMQEIHRAIRRAREARSDHPVQAVAAETSAHVQLLCFDEFQVENIADAMILGQLFESLFREGVTIVLTSNRPPEELYLHGLNRKLFLPFIALIQERLDLHEMAGSQDHRLVAPSGARYFTPLGAKATHAMDTAWRQVVADQPVTTSRLCVQGRDFLIPCSTARAARLDFEGLCGEPRGPADFLALAEAFETLFLDGVPRLPADRRDVAKRLTTLVDALYEAGRGLVCSADAEPDELCTEGDASFAFRRTASRLHEMRSRTWGPKWLAAALAETACDFDARGTRQLVDPSGSVANELKS